MRYVALLRGIGPGNPNMANHKLREVFEQLGFKSVQSVISSGNIIFDSDETDAQKLETLVEEAWPEKLGFNSTTVIRSQEELQALVKMNPFGTTIHGPSSYTLVTFFKKPTKVPFDMPYQPSGKTYEFIAVTNSELFSLTDNTLIPTADLMTWLEKQFGKEITSRTWLTVQRILKRMKD